MGINSRKAAGPDGILGRLLNSYADQLSPVSTPIFNLSLANSAVSFCFKISMIIPVPEKSNRSKALNSVVMKCFKKLVKNIICSFIPVAH